MRVTRWRVEVRLAPGGRQLLRSLMKIRGLSAMDLAKLCGSATHRSSIGHLISGQRDGCSEHLAQKITKILLGDAAKDTPLFVPRVYAVTQDVETPRRAA